MTAAGVEALREGAAAFDSEQGVAISDRRAAAQCGAHRGTRLTAHLLSASTSAPAHQRHSAPPSERLAAAACQALIQECP